MTDYGTIYDPNIGNLDSIVNLANAPTGTSFISTTSYANVSAKIFIRDDGNEREVAFMEQNQYGVVTDFVIYDVDVTGSSINLRNTTTIAYDDAETKMTLGIKKISDSLYYIYYAACPNGYSGTAPYLKFRRISVTPGVGYTDDILQTVTFSGTGFRFDPRHIVIGKIGYIGILKCYPNATNCNRYDVYIYSFNIDTESVAGGLEWTAPNDHVRGWDDDLGYTHLVLANSNGTLFWTSVYVEDVSTTRVDGHVVVNGTDNTVFTKTYGTPSAGRYKLFDPHGFICQYNRRDFLNLFIFSESGGDTNRTRIGPGGSPTNELNPATTIIISSFPSFSSQNTFPAIKWNSVDSKFHWIDVDTGLSTGEVTIAGVSLIREIYPTLDSYNNSIYMDAVRNVSTEILGINPSTLGINSELGDDASMWAASSLRYYFNHGNFFIMWEDIVSSNAGGINICYLNSPTPFGLNIVQMIIEQN